MITIKINPSSENSKSFSAETDDERKLLVDAIAEWMDTETDEIQEVEVSHAKTLTKVEIRHYEALSLLDTHIRMRNKDLSDFQIQEIVKTAAFTGMVASAEDGKECFFHVFKVWIDGELQRFELLPITADCELV